MFNTQSLISTVKAVLAFAGMLMLWHLATTVGDVPEYILPSPGDVGRTFVDTFAIQIHHLAATAAATVAGLGLALVVGLALALLVIYFSSLKAIILPTLAAFNSIPKIAVAPLFIIWFGLGPESKILLAFLLSIFPIFVNSVTGLSEIENDLLDMARLAGGNELRIFQKVRLMNALPYITDALKVAFPLALVGAIVGEFIGGNRGIGYLILSGQFSMDTALVFSALLSITMFTTLGIGAVVIFEALVLTWRPSQRKR